MMAFDLRSCIFWIWVVFCLSLIAGCGESSSTTSSGAEEAAGAGLPKDNNNGFEHEGEPPKPLHPLPPGPAGPVTFEKIAGVVTAYGWSAAIEKSAAMVYRVRGGKCATEKLSRCDRWYAMTLSRSGDDPSETHFLAESDTPSGVVFDAMVAGDQRFLSLWREGAYTGDQASLRARLLPGGVKGGEALLKKGATFPISAAALHLGKDRFVVCWQAQGASKDLLKRKRGGELWCRDLSSSSAPKAPRRLLKEDRLGYRTQLTMVDSPRGGLIAWVRKGTLEVGRLDDQGLLIRKPHRIGLAGSVVSRPISLVYGHEGYLIGWQDLKGKMIFQRLDKHAAPEGDPLLLDVEPFTLSDGLAVVPEGFMIATRHDVSPDPSIRASQNKQPRIITTNIWGIDPHAQVAHRVSRVNASSRLLLSGINLLHVSSSHSFAWRLAASIIQR